MYKVENGVASKEPLPSFLKGLEQHDLLDLSWTDPALGVSNAGWWPVERVGYDRNDYRSLGEVLTPDAERQVVVISHSLELITEEEKAAAAAEELVAQRGSMTITMRQCRLALLAAGLLNTVDTALASLPEPDKSAATIAWEYGASVERLSTFVVGMGPMLGLTDAEVDALFEGAKGL